jgi:hypothetical protein
LTQKEITKKLICFGVDGASIFQGCYIGVKFQLRVKFVPCMMGQHCMAHKMNFIIQVLSNVPMVAKLENLLQSLYFYYSSSTMQNLELTKLAEILEIRRLKILRNVKIQWINMLKPLKRVMAKY